MAKNRDRQKENKKKKYAEQRLDSKNAYGISDKTPREAVNNMIEKSKGVK